MTTLEKLYYGNIEPANKYIKRGSEYSKLVNLFIRNKEKSLPTFSRCIQIDYIHFCKRLRSAKSDYIHGLRCD